MVNKNLILVAGSPATGKSKVVETIKNIFKGALEISPDNIKEMYADSVGYSNLNEKSRLEEKAWEFYYSILEKYMEAGKDVIITEYPFSNKQYNNLKKLSQDYKYNVLTVRLTAEFETLWKRRYKRDREPGRHLSHLMKSYKFGDELEDRERADNHISKSSFKKIITDRKYDEFALGELFEVDMTDFGKVDYESISNFLNKNIK